MLWEHLVTEGHVRAARLRRVSPAFLALSALLVALSGMYAIYQPPVSVALASPDLLMSQRKQQLIQEVQARFLKAPLLSVSSADLQEFPPEDQLPAVLKALKDSLQSTGSLPSTFPITAAKDPDAFWSWDWPYKSVVSLDRGDLRAFGAVVASTPPNGASRPVRWLAIFRKTSSGWNDVDVRANGFVILKDEPQVSPSDIPVSLNELMGAETMR